MSDISGAPPEKGQSQFEKVQGERTSLFGEVIAFLAHNKKWWLLPIAGTFLIIGVLVLLSTTAAAPFIYTFF
jgi:hypothetical protein